VAGTGGSGLEIVRELELYVAAGFSPSEAFQVPLCTHISLYLFPSIALGVVSAGRSPRTNWIPLSNIFELQFRTHFLRADIVVSIFK
jgi:hypothetical protein